MSRKSPEVSRRRLLGLAGTAGLVPLLMPAAGKAIAAEAPVPGQLRFRSVSVDTQPLADKGLSAYAGRVAKEAQPIVATVFADRLTPNRSDAPRLVVRIDLIELSSGGEQSTGFGLGPAANSDWIAGAGEIIDAHGKILRTEPIHTSAPSYGGQGADVLAVEALRTRQLITLLAEWINKAI